MRNNLSFLREFCAERLHGRGLLPHSPLRRHADGAADARRGPAVGPALEADYRFLDPRLDALWDFSLVAFADRNYGKDAMWDRLRGLLFEARLEYPERPYDPDFRQAAQTLTASSNALLLDVAEEAVDLIEALDAHDATDPALVALARYAREEDERVRRMLNALWQTRRREVTAELFR